MCSENTIANCQLLFHVLKHQPEGNIYIKESEGNIFICWKHNFRKWMLFSFREMSFESRHIAFLIKIVLIHNARYVTIAVEKLIPCDL